MDACGPWGIGFGDSTSNQDVVRDVSFASTGNLLAGGTFTGTVSLGGGDFDNTAQDGWVAVLANDGTHVSSFALGVDVTPPSPPRLTATRT